MKLRETNWDAPGGAAEYEVEYPDAVIADFVNWMRKSSAWLENLELVHRRVRRLNGVLSDWRDSPMATSDGAVVLFTARPAIIDAPVVPEQTALNAERMWKKDPIPFTAFPAVPDVPSAVEVHVGAIALASGDRESVDRIRAAEIKAKRQANMAKAQAALKAKREAAKAAR